MSEGARSVGQTQAPERPFPWFCPRCRRQEVWRETIAYECQREVRGEPVTVAVADLAVPRCRNCGELVFDYVAEEQINRVCRARTHAADGPNGTEATSSVGEPQQQSEGRVSP
jgi:hypothetical protein